MEKDELIQYANDLYQGAFDANQYFLLMQQYKRYQKDYLPEMQLSPAFYSVVYEALQKACFVEIAKLYDQSSGVVSIGFLLKACQETIRFSLSIGISSPSKTMKKNTLSLSHINIA